MNDALDRWIQGLPLNAQFRDELRRFAGDALARWCVLGFALALGVALAATWPASPVIELGREPLAYRVTGALAVLIAAYLGLAGGVWARPAGGRFTVKEWAAYVPLAPGAYLRGALGGQLLEPALFILLALPLLVPGAMVHGATAGQFAALLLILAGTAISTRLCAHTLLLWLPERTAPSLIAAHVALVVMLALGHWAWGPLSPLAAFLGTLDGGEGPRASGWWAAWPGFLIVHGVLAGALFALAWWRVRALRLTGASRPAGSAQA